MINLGSDVTFEDLHLRDTGLYGLYPVEVVGVLVQDCSVTGARDAGIYVGQSKDILVRRNVVHGNVTGIEIENSLHAVVEDNEVYDNGGCPTACPARIGRRGAAGPTAACGVCWRRSSDEGSCTLLPLHLASAGREH